MRQLIRDARYLGYLWPTIIFVILLVFLVADGKAAAPDTRVARLHVDGRHTWRTPLPANADVEVIRVRVGGKAIALGHQAGRCGGEMYGRGTVLRFHACDRFTIIAATVAPRQIGVRYEITYP